MTEQCKHEWESMHGYLVWCPKCRRPPKAEDVIRALNATERLIAEWVRIALEQLERILATDAGFLADLRAYANILEGKDD